MAKEKNSISVETLRQSTNALLIEYWTELKGMSRLELEKVTSDLEIPVLKVAVARGLLECARTGMSVVDLLNRIDPMPATLHIQTLMTSILGRDLEKIQKG